MQKPKNTIIAVIENNPSVLQELRAKCDLESETNSQFAQFKIVQIPVLDSKTHSVCDVQGVVLNLRKVNPSLIILDLALLPADLACGHISGKEPSGIKVLRELSRSHPKVPVIVFSNMIDDPLVRKTLLDIQRARDDTTIELIPKQNHHWPRLMMAISQLTAPLAVRPEEPNRDPEPNYFKNLARRIWRVGGRKS